MDGMAVIVFRDEIEKDKEKKGVPKKVILWLVHIFLILKALVVKEKIIIEIKKNQVYDDFNLYILILPFNIDELSRMGKKEKKRIDKAISEIIKEKAIGACFFPELIYEALQPDSGTTNLYTGDILYTALLKSTLKELYGKRGKMLGDLEFCIICGEEKEEILCIVNQLISEVKYITAVVKDKRLILDEIDKIFTETGVSVIVSEDISNSARKADIVIFLKSAGDIICPRLNSGTIVVDINRKYGIKRRIENTIVKGIQVKLPLKLFLGIDKRVYAYFNTLTIAEMILTAKVWGGWFKNREEYTSARNNYTFLENLSNEFGHIGCSISGIEGNNGVFGMKDIK